MRRGRSPWSPEDLSNSVADGAIGGLEGAAARRGVGRRFAKSLAISSLRLDLGPSAPVHQRADGCATRAARRVARIPTNSCDFYSEHRHSRQAVFGALGGQTDSDTRRCWWGGLRDCEPATDVELTSTPTRVTGGAARLGAGLWVPRRANFSSTHHRRGKP